MQETIRAVIAEIPRDRESKAAIEAFQRKVQRHHSPTQQIELLSQAVMTPLDRRAETIVRRASARAHLLRRRGQEREEDPTRSQANRASRGERGQGEGA